MDSPAIPQTHVARKQLDAEEAMGEAQAEEDV